MTYRLVVKPAQISGDTIALDAQQSHYLLRVLRLVNGDRFMALDGIGHAWMVELEGNSARMVEAVEVDTELPRSLSLVTALPKGSGYEEVIRCCTELGVSNFYPVISDRTILKPSSQKVERWRKIALEAAEQSERQVVPHVLKPVKFADFVINSITEAKYICVARGDLPTLWDCMENNTDSAIAIATGCEGGWTEREVATAISSGYQPINLGKRILRAVTAPIVVSAIAMAVLEGQARKV